MSFLGRGLLNAQLIRRVPAEAWNTSFRAEFLRIVSEPHIRLRLRRQFPKQLHEYLDPWT